MVAILSLGCLPVSMARVVTMHTAEIAETVVPVHPDRTLTVIFPGPVQAVSGGGFTPDPETFDGEYLLAHQPGANHLSIIPLPESRRPDAPLRNLNIYHDGGIYVLIPLPVGEASEAWTGLRFVQPPPPPVLGQAPPPEDLVGRHQSPPPGPPRVPPSPARLIGLVDTMKMFMALDRPTLRAAVARMPHIRLGLRAGDTHNIGPDLVGELHMVAAHVEMGGLGFALSLTNRADSSIVLPIETFAVKAGQHVYPSTLADGPRVLEAGESALYYFVVAGDHHGRPTRLDVTNRFTLLLNPPEVLP